MSFIKKNGLSYPRIFPLVQLFKIHHKILSFMLNLLSHNSRRGVAFLFFLFLSFSYWYLPKPVWFLWHTGLFSPMALLPTLRLLDLHLHAGLKQMIWLTLFLFFLFALGRDVETYNLLPWRLSFKLW